MGGEAPDFEVSLTNGESFRLSDCRGKVVLINIWATWCGPCVAEMPDLQQLAQDYAGKAIIVGVNCGEPEETVREFVEQNGYTYPIALDPDYLVSGMLYPTMSIPYTIVVDANGVITQLHLGGGDGMYSVYEQYVLDAMESAPLKLA